MPFLLDNAGLPLPRIGKGKGFGEYQTSPFSATCSFTHLQLAPSLRSACYLALLSGNIDLYTGSE